MKPISIRDARLADIPALAALGAATFAGTFQSLYSKENLSRFLDAYHSQSYYRQALSDPSVRLWIAEQDGELVAYAKASPNSLPCDPPRPDALELSRLYTLKSHQGLRIGHDLMEEIISHAKRQNHDDVVLSVFSENFGAHRFYARYGFTKIGEYKFQVGDHFDAEWIMCKLL